MVNYDEDKQAKARRELGLTRQLRVTRTPLPEPNKGGCRGYPVWFRIAELQRAANGEPTTVHRSTLARWRRRLHPYRMTGNRDRTQLVGDDQLRLAICLLIYPEATSAEIAMFIFNNGGNIYTEQQISTRSDELKLTRKRASTEAYQAFYPQNILRLENFFSMPPPLGIVGVPRHCQFDVDECAISLEKCNRNTGRGFMGVRIRKPGHYTRGKKLTVILAIEPGNPALPAGVDGSIQNPRRWVQVTEDVGTDAQRYADFMDEVCTSIENAAAQTGDTYRVPMHDNLSSHYAPIVYQTVEGRPQGPVRFEIVPRPPYQPKHGPTEYAFCELICELKKRVKANWTLQILRNEILNILGSMGRNGQFNALWEHCGL